MIGRRLRLARAAAGYSLRELEDKLAKLVSAQAIGKYERDEMMPSSDVLPALALALGVSMQFLLSEQEIELEGVEFRRSPLATKKEQLQVEALVLDHIGRYLEIEELIGLPVAEWDRPKVAPYPVSDLSSVETAALSVREYWRLGVDAIPNLAEFLEERGIKILCLELPDLVDGLTCFAKLSSSRRVPVIVVNQKHTGERQRFTLCHEVAHLILQPSPGLEEEKVMHRFAGAFLMPADELRTQLGRVRHTIALGELFRLKPIFGVSAQAIAYRCLDLQIIKRSAMKELFDAFDRNGWRKPPYKEPQPVQREKATRFTRLCMRALMEGATTESKTADLMGMTVSEVREQLNCAEVRPG
jgi:Zn-dependent peptidase ImmA (M78 family)